MTGTEKKRLPAVILAGAPASEELKEAYGVEWRALAPVCGAPMLCYIIDALKASGRAQSISVVSGFPCEGVDKTIPSANSMLENLVNGVGNTAESGHVLIATSDIPLITPEAIADFTDRCGNLDADFYYPIVPKEQNLSKFPKLKRTYARLAEGTFTGGNIMIVDAKFIKENAQRIKEALDARKSVSRLAKIIGAGVLIRAILAQTIWPGALKLSMLEKAAGRVLGARLRAVETPYAEIGADADTVGQIALAEEILQSRET